MIFELLAVIFAGLAGAGLMLMISRFASLPRWWVPMGAGAAMLAATLSSEYGWYGRTAASLPQGVVVAQTLPVSVPWRPWSYVMPLTEGFVAVDRGNLRPNSQTPDLYLADVYLFGRWQPVRVIEVMVDCAGQRRADPGQSQAAEPVWRDVGADDPVVAKVCEVA